MQQQFSPVSQLYQKSFTVDNQASVVGSRNMADEYFQLKDDNVFADFDVLAIGPIVDEISKIFDQYWNRSHAVPIDYFASNKNEDLETVGAKIVEGLDSIYDTVYSQTLESPLLQDLLAERQPLVPADARVLSDSPDKLINAIGDEQKLLAKDLGEVFHSAEEEIIFITPYYVPRDGWIQLLGNLTDRGLWIIIVTDSLASNNHVPVHSGWAKYRKDVIMAGAELYEVRGNAARVNPSLTDSL